MLVIPEIDLRRGRCVRLTDGRYEDEKVFFVDPVRMARLWRVMNARVLHIVDTDSAAHNRALIGDIVRALDIPVEVGGGINTLDDAAALLELGVYRVVLPESFGDRTEMIGEAVDRFGSTRVVVAIHPAANDDDAESAGEAAARLEAAGVRRFLYADVGDEGTLAGPDLLAYRVLADHLSKARITAGGVAGYRDLLALNALGQPVDSVIAGRALYENRFPCQQFWAWHEKETLDLEHFSTAPLAEGSK